MAKEVMHKRFGCTESEFGTQGHNKLWYVTVYDNGDIKTEYGRTGDVLKENVKSLGSQAAALIEAEKQIAKKKKGKSKKDSDERDSVYSELEIAEITNNTITGGKIIGKSLQKKAAEQIAAGDKIIEDLVNKFSKENVHNITSNTSMKYDDTTGMFTTPAGVVGQTAIDNGRSVLSKIRPYVEKGDTENPSGSKLIDEYLRNVPQNTGRNRPSMNLICGTMNEFDKQVSILDSLQASLDMLSKQDDSDKDKTIVEEKIWNVTMKLNENSVVFDYINKLYKKTHQTRHACGHLNMKRIFDVDHHGMTKDFEAHGRKMGNVWELWHGTRVGNILSILSKGMIIPPSNQSHCTGRMFSDGVYFSDQSTKSLNYAYGYWGGNSDNNCFMFLSEVAMGKFMVPNGPTNKKPPAGYDSYFAKANKSGVMNNEMIVFNTHQARPKYLIEFGK